MNKYLITSTALAALLMSGPAYAQKMPETSPRDAPAAQQQMPSEEMDKDKSGDKSGAAQASDSLEFVASQEEKDWLIADLIGRSVENSQGESLGDVSNVVMAENGEIRSVIIGVGGFLGIGAKHIAVPFEALSFKETAKESAGAGSTNLASSRQPGDVRVTPNPAQPGATAQRRPASPAEKAVQRQRNIVLVLDATKEQLASAPAFKYLGDQAREAGKQEQGAPASPGSPGSTPGAPAPSQ